MFQKEEASWIMLAEAEERLVKWKAAVTPARVARLHATHVVPISATDAALHLFRGYRPVSALCDAVSLPTKSLCEDECGLCWPVGAGGAW